MSTMRAKPQKGVSQRENAILTRRIGACALQFRMRAHTPIELLTQPPIRYGRAVTTAAGASGVALAARLASIFARP